MSKYYLGTDNKLIIAIKMGTDVEQNMVSIHVYYSDFNTPAGSTMPEGLAFWNNNWSKLDTEGKKNIIKKKFK